MLIVVRAEKICVRKPISSLSVLMSERKYSTSWSWEIWIVHKCRQMPCSPTIILPLFTDFRPKIDMLYMCPLSAFTFRIWNLNQCTSENCIQTNVQNGHLLDQSFASCSDWHPFSKRYGHQNKHLTCSSTGSGATTHVFDEEQCHMNTNPISAQRDEPFKWSLVGQWWNGIPFPLSICP